MKRLIAGLFAIGLAGCASGYSTFYQPIPFSSSVALEPTAEEPRVVAGTGDLTNDVHAMFAEGYWPIGSASFNGRNEGVAGALAQAKKVGATRVVVAAKYASTVNGAIPLTMPTYTTATTSGTVTGTRGSATYSGQTVFQGSQTTYLPYSIDRYDQTAAFFAPLARTGFGIQANDLSPEQARARGSNKGVVVAAVRRGSPAFLADIIPGDIITEASGEAMYSQQVLGVLFKRRGIIPMVIDRDGKVVHATVTIAPDGRW